MSVSTKEGNLIAYGFIAFAGAGLLFLIGKKVFYDIYCKPQQQQSQENQIQEDPCEVC